MAHDRVEAVERALSILEAFGPETESLSLSELAEETGLYKSTILRLSASLQRYGYLSRDEAGRFRLGSSVWRLGSAYRRAFDMGEHIRPVLRMLMSETGESASFSVRDGGERVCLYRENSRHPMRHHLDEGVRLPLDRGAAAAILRVYAADPGSLLDTDREVARSGFAVSIGERSPDVAAVAVPVLRPNGALSGALAVSGLVTRFDSAARQQALGLLKRAADRLGEQLV